MPVVLLCHADGTNGSTAFTDASLSAHTLTATSTTVSTTSPKFGTGSADFTATSAARIDTGNATDFNFGAGQFTVEAWVWYTSTPGRNISIIGQWGGGWFLGSTPTNLFSFYWSTDGSNFFNVTGAYAPTLNTWIHIAADRDTSNVLRIYANGAVIASATRNDTLFPTTNNCLIGNDSGSGSGFPGRIDEVRVSKGIAHIWRCVYATERAIR